MAETTFIRSSTTQPQEIGRSPLKPFLTGVRAALATDAQRRDDESDFDFSWRSLYLTSGWMQEEVKLSENATRQMAEFFERIGEDGVLHMLVQSVPASDGTTTLSGVIPLSGDGSMAPALVEWASAEANLVTSTTDIDGWPVYRIADFRDFGIVDHTNLFFVVTDHSVVWIIGTEEAVPLLETIVRREFPPDEEGNVFARSVATVKCDAPSLLKFPAMTEIIDDLLPDRDDEQPLQTGMTLSVTAEPQSLMLTVHFERDAAVVGLMLFESGFITLAELVLDW